jgi:hypothetical protein
MARMFLSTVVEHVVEHVCAVGTVPDPECET